MLRALYPPSFKLYCVPLTSWKNSTSKMNTSVPVPPGAVGGVAVTVVCALSMGRFTAGEIDKSDTPSAKFTFPHAAVKETCVEFGGAAIRSEEHTSELQSRPHLVCRL